MRVFPILLLVLLLTLFVLGACRALNQAIHGQSRIEGPPLEGILRRLKATCDLHPQHCGLIRFGSSLLGRPLVALRIARSQRAPERRTAMAGRRPAVLITGVAHGNEYLSIADRLPGSLLERRSFHGTGTFLNRGGALFVIPVLNPDGYAALSRANAAGIDLNRAFTVGASAQADPHSRHTPEAAALVAFLRRQVSLGYDWHLALDYHCCAGALLFPPGMGLLPETHGARAETYRSAERALLREFPRYRTGTIASILGYQARGTLADLLRTEFGAAAMTFEGVARTESENLHRHVLFWEALLSEL